MKEEFWRQKWERNDTAFHQSEANPALVRHFEKLSLAPSSRVFVPLCGKTLDIHWLLSKGLRVAGAELSTIAVEQLFAELDRKPAVSKVGAMERYSAPDIDIFAGNLFDLTRQELGPVSAIYDRAALVALPKDMRARYAKHLVDLSNASPQLLICYEYDQSQHEGPPFSITNDEVHRHYGGTYRLACLESEHVAGGLKGKCAAKENIWLLKN